MEVLNANYWEDYSDYAAKKAAKTKYTERKKAIKKERKKKLKDHNSTLKGIAKHYAKDMRDEPSALEKKMMELLDRFSIQYEFQKPLFIKKKNSYIRKFYIADFYIPSKGIIIETDGKFHDDQVKQDEKRTKEIQKYHSNMKVIRWRWHDFDSYNKVKNLIDRLK